MAAASIEFDYFDTINPVSQESFTKIRDLLEMSKKAGKARERWIHQLKKDTGQEVFIGVVVWDLMNVVHLNRLYAAFNELIPPDRPRVKLPKEWLCAANKSSSRLNTKK